MTFHQHIEMARVKIDQGDIDTALQYADGMLAVDHAFKPALQVRCRALFLLGRDREALETFHDLYDIVHQPEPAIDMLSDDDFPEGPSQEDDLVLADETFETLLALHRRLGLDDELLALLGEMGEDTGRFELARTAFEELIHRAPDNLNAWEGLVHVVCSDDLDAGLEIVQHALDRFSTHPMFHEFYGYIHFRRRRYPQAMEAYRRAIDYGATHIDNYQSLVQCHLAMGEKDAALAITRKLAREAPNSAESHHYAIEVALECDDQEMALKHAHQLLRLEPTYPESYTYKARVELAFNQWEEARRTLLLCFHKAVDGVLALFDLVDLLIADGEAEQALLVADLVHELAPTHAESSAARGKALRELGRLDDALAAFREAATQAPQDDMYQTWIGVVLDNMGEYHTAMRQYNKVLHHHPTDVWTLSNRGLTFLALEMTEKALADFAVSIELDPENAPLYFWRACARVKLGDRNEAFHDLQRAVDLSDEIREWLEREPTLEAVRNDPRFRALLAPADEQE